MDTLKTAAEYLAIFTVGLAARAAVFVAIVAALLAVILPILYAFEGGRRLAHRLTGEQVAHGLTWRRRPAYTPGHLWVRERGFAVRLGIDGLAARLLRHTDALELPREGTELRKGQALATFTAGSDLVMLRAPIDGRVARVNWRLRGRPALAADHPYGRGWLLEMLPAGALAGTVPRESSFAWFEREAARFTDVLEHAAGMAAADGGEPLEPERLLLTGNRLTIVAGEFLDAQVMSRSTWVAKGSSPRIR